MGPADERALARKLLADELRRLAADAYADGREPLDKATEDAIATAVLDRLHGLARLQPLLDDPSIRDIHLSGAKRVWPTLSAATKVRGTAVAENGQEEGGETGCEYGDNMNFTEISKKKKQKQKV